jgi:hypothetical protein
LLRRVGLPFDRDEELAIVLAINAHLHAAIVVRLRLGRRLVRGLLARLRVDRFELVERDAAVAEPVGRLEVLAARDDVLRAVREQKSVRRA